MHYMLACCRCISCFFFKQKTAYEMRISDWSSDLFSSDLISFDIENDGGYIQLNLTNPDPVGDRPNPTTNEIHRRVFNATNPDTPYQVVGNADPNGTFKDFTAASGVLYEYRARALAGEFFTDSTDTDRKSTRLNSSH